MVVDQLLADLLVHASQRVVGSGKAAFQLRKGVLHKFFHCDPLLLGDAGGQTKTIDGTANPDTCGMDRDIIIDIALDLLDIHVRGVLGIRLDSMVVLDHSIEDLSKVLVGVPVSGVDAAVLVVELDSAGDGFGDGEAAGLGLDVLDLVPPLLGHVLGYQ